MYVNTLNGYHLKNQQNIQKKKGKTKNKDDCENQKSRSIINIKCSTCNIFFGVRRLFEIFTEYQTKVPQIKSIKYNISLLML